MSTDPDPLSHVVIDFPADASPAARDFYVQHGTDMRLLNVELVQARALVDLTSELGQKLPHEPTPYVPELEIVSWGKSVAAAAERNLPLRMQQFITMAVDNYYVYVADIATTLLNGASLPSKLRYYKGFAELAANFNGQFGLPLVGDKAVEQEICVAAAIRNLLVHQRGRVDQQFLDRLTNCGASTSGYTLGKRIEGNQHVAAVTAVATAVRDLDRRAVGQFAIQTVPVDKHAWMKDLLAIQAWRPEVDISGLVIAD